MPSRERMPRRRGGRPERWACARYLFFVHGTGTPHRTAVNGAVGVQPWDAAEAPKAAGPIGVLIGCGPLRRERESRANHRANDGHFVSGSAKGVCRRHGFLRTCLDVGLQQTAAGNGAALTSRPACVPTPRSAYHANLGGGLRQAQGLTRGTIRCQALQEIEWVILEHSRAPGACMSGS